MRKVLVGAAVVIVSFTGTLWAIGTFSPSSGPTNRPQLTELPPLKPVSRTSTIVAPTAIGLTAIRNALEAAAPRDFSGQSSNPVSELLSKAEIGVTMGRGPIAVAGRGEGLAITTPLNGTFRVTGQLGTQASKLTGSLGNLISSAVGREVQNLTGRILDQGADVRGNVVLLSRPTITPEWRLDPNLSAQVLIGDGALSVAGLKINVANEVRPMLERAVNEQVTALDARLREDPFIEETARREWSKMCRSIPLGGANTGLPNLWLELRPTQAFTAQPRVDANSLILTVGVQAETRIVGEATKPSCPFPSRLSIVPQTEQGRIAIGVPIDLPFTEVSKLLEAQVKGRRFPEDGSSPVEVEVQRASIGASGDKMLISLHVKAHEKKSWFGFGAEVDLHVWGVPVLDRDKQMLRFTDVAMAVESEAAFGLLGAAASAARPYLRSALEENATVDLKPFLANAKQKISAALADFREDSDELRIDAAIQELRLVDIEFDSKTLRVIAQARGTARATVTKLTGM